MTAESNICTCINCKQNFTRWERVQECPNTSCEDGIEEIEEEFGDGSHYRQCRDCGGTGEVKDFEWDFCSEECIEELTGEQLGYC